VLRCVPFAVIALVAMVHLDLDRSWWLLPVIVVAPAIASVIGGAAYTLFAGSLAILVCLIFALDLPGGSMSQRAATVSIVAAAGVTTAAIAVSQARGRQDRQLAEALLVSEVAQRIMLRPVPPRAGPVRLAVRYQSAALGARIGGDLYEVISTPEWTRIIVGDAEGKGLPGVQMAAAALGAFREAAFDEDCLARIAARIEASLARQLDSEQFVTAVLAQITPAAGTLELISCGHPAPLLLGPGGPQEAGPVPASLPLGLGGLGTQPPASVTLPFGAGDAALFYTDGVTEARDHAGWFFPLAEHAARCNLRDPQAAVDQLAAAVSQHVGHHPADDIALLLACHAPSGDAPAAHGELSSHQAPAIGLEPITCRLTGGL
jgi:serine phosphatase RsbU (regulator of sigma subunit)